MADRQVNFPGPQTPEEVINLCKSVSRRLNCGVDIHRTYEDRISSVCTGDHKSEGGCQRVYGSFHLLDSQGNNSLFPFEIGRTYRTIENWFSNFDYIEFISPPGCDEDEIPESYFADINRLKKEVATYFWGEE